MDYASPGCAHTSRKPPSDREAHPQRHVFHIGNWRPNIPITPRSRTIPTGGSWKTTLTMSRVSKIEAIIAKCTPKERSAVLRSVQKLIPRHPFEIRMNAPADIILDALERSSDLIVRGVRGVVGEAVFVRQVIPRLRSWKNITTTGDHPYDVALQDRIGTVRIQIKMQRRVKGKPMIRNNCAVVEVQRTRTGIRAGEQTRPYRFGEFDILAVCVEPSTGNWNSFRYIPERWLKARKTDASLIDILQPVSIKTDKIWTDDFEIAVSRMRSRKPRPKLI